MSEFISAAEQDDEISLEQWLKRTGQTPLAIRHFWEPVVLCTLNDSFANCSLRDGGQSLSRAFSEVAAGGEVGNSDGPVERTLLCGGTAA